MVTSSMFDGERYQGKMERTVVIDGDQVSEVCDGDQSSVFLGPGAEVEHVAFLMPGLVEGHAHLFLDGGELDTAVRGAYLKSSVDNMVDVGRRNLRRSAESGVTLIRDAGDRFGVNHIIRAEAASSGGFLPRVRSAGLGLRGPRGYGAFMAREVGDLSRLSEVVDELAEESDDIKVVLTGIIDFQSGAVKGVPQFDFDSCRKIVETAHSAGRKTFAHCSGLDGLAIAVEAGIDSIEHGFFMNEEMLVAMAEKQIAWVPTFSPVDFQWRSPQWCGWDSETQGKLREILDQHFRQVALAAELGVPLVCGSDAGSHGVPHGSSLIDEVEFLLQAGLNMQMALASATSVPRRLWGEEPAGPLKRARAELVVLAASPFDDPTALRRVEAVIMGRNVVRSERGMTLDEITLNKSAGYRPGG